MLLPPLNEQGKDCRPKQKWEYAARGGLSGKQYCWGDTEPNGKQSNYADKNTNYNYYYRIYKNLLKQKMI